MYQKKRKEKKDFSAHTLPIQSTQLPKPSIVFEICKLFLLIFIPSYLNGLLIFLFHDFLVFNYVDLLMTENKVSMLYVTLNFCS